MQKATNLTHVSISGVYGFALAIQVQEMIQHCVTLRCLRMWASFALFDEFVGTDPLDRATFAGNVLDFLGCRKFS